MFDVLIVGGGPAGVSAALTLLRRGRSCAIITLSVEENPLFRTGSIDNYPGLPGVSGADFLRALEEQSRSAGVEIITGKATAMLPMGASFGVSVGQEFYESRALILCPGINKSGEFPGEREFLGRGVSYCVTCDGILYRGRDVAVIGFTGDAKEETELLNTMGCRARLFTSRAARYAIEGGDKVERVLVNGEAYPCEGVFILRAASAPDTLLPDLAMDGAHVRTDRRMSTNLPGVFAAGDCTGEPYQVAKAAGEGNIAAMSADAWLKETAEGR